MSKKHYLSDQQRWLGLCWCVVLCHILIFLSSGCDHKPMLSAEELGTSSLEASEDFKPLADLPSSRVTDYDSLREVLLDLALSLIMLGEFDEAIRLLNESTTLPHNDGSASAAVRNMNFYEAYNYLGGFSDILRTITKTATSISIDLDQEIDM